MEQAYTKTVEDVADYFGVDLETGLTDEQIKKNRDKYGPNGMLLFIFLFHSCKLITCFSRAKKNGSVHVKK